MSSKGAKFLVLTAVLMIAAAPALADDHVNETGEDPDVPVETDNETEEYDNSTDDPEVDPVEEVEVETLEEARNRIEELKGVVRDLREEVAELEDEESEEDGEDSGEKEPEEEEPVEEESEEDEEESGEEESDEQESEEESEEEEGRESSRGPPSEARGNVNGTPGSEEAQENRPGFVNNLLGGLFG